MNTWDTVELGEICTITIGKTPSRNNSNYWNGQHPWLSISDMNQGRDILTTKERITSQAIQECKCRLVPQGTLMLSFKLSIGKLGFARVPLYTNEAIAALPVKNPKRVSPEFLYYALQALDLTETTDRAVKGQTLNSDKLHDIRVPLPHPDEQKRIAARLSKADRLRRLRRTALEMSAGYLQSVFLEMFGDPATNPMGWEIATVSELGKVQTGNTPSRTEPENYGAYIEWIKTDNIPADALFVTTSAEGLSEIGLQKGRAVPPYSLLITCIAGSITSVGRAALTDRKVAFNQQINAVTPNSDVDPHFLYQLIKVAQPIIQHHASDGMKHILTKSGLEEILLFKPSYLLQQRFGHMVAQHERLRAQQREALRQAEHLFQTLLHESFG